MPQINKSRILPFIKQCNHPEYWPEFLYVKKNNLKNHLGGCLWFLSDYLTFYNSGLNLETKLMNTLHERQTFVDSFYAMG